MDRSQHLSACLADLCSEFIEVLWSSRDKSDSVARFGEETAVFVHTLSVQVGEEGGSTTYAVAAPVPVQDVRHPCLYPLRRKDLPLPLPIPATTNKGRTEDIFQVDKVMKKRREQ